MIPLQIRIETDYFLYTSWNLFVTLVSVPSILLALWLTRFPESPKFLFECGEYDQALDVLRTMFSSNTGKEVEHYPVSNGEYDQTLRTMFSSNTGKEVEHNR